VFSLTGSQPHALRRQRGELSRHRKAATLNAEARRPVFFVLNEDMDAATDSLTDAAAARATVYASDPASPPVMATDRSTYTPQGLTTSTPARVEWVVNRSLDFSASAGAAGMAIWINGELLVFWVDCTSGT
jgi:hypothetical protein